MVVRGSEGSITFGTLPLSGLITCPEKAKTCFQMFNNRIYEVPLPETIVAKYMETFRQNSIFPLHLARRTRECLFVFSDLLFQDLIHI